MTVKVYQLRLYCIIIEIGGFWCVEMLEIWLNDSVEITRLKKVIHSGVLLE